MNKVQYLLTCFNEELSEVQQEVSKCLRFTPHHTPVGIYDTTNLQRVHLEIADVYAISHMLQKEGLELKLEPMVMSPEMVTRYHEKILRTEKLMEISFELGVLDV
jgi:hypothetical protein